MTISITEYTPKELMELIFSEELRIKKMYLKFCPNGNNETIQDFINWIKNENFFTFINPKNNLTHQFNEPTEALIEYLNEEKQNKLTLQSSGSTFWGLTRDSEELKIEINEFFNFLLEMEFSEDYERFYENLQNN